MSFGKTVYQALKRGDYKVISRGCFSRGLRTVVEFPNAGGYMKLSIWRNLAPIDVYRIESRGSCYEFSYDAGRIGWWWSYRIKKLIDAPYREIVRKEEQDRQQEKKNNREWLQDKIENYLKNS